jgi:hypothetical protein
MQISRRCDWLLGGWLWIGGLAIAAGGGCQMEPNLPPAPTPYYPKDMFQLMSTKPKAEYTLSEDAAALKPDPLDAKPQTK